MDSIITNNYPIHFNNKAYEELNIFVKKNNFSKIIVLTDSNTKLLCLEKFYSKFDKTCDTANISFILEKKIRIYQPVKIYGLVSQIMV